MRGNEALLLLAGGRIPIPPIVRGPLSFPDPNRDGSPFVTTLPWTVPPIPDIRYSRGDAWGVEMPDAPLVLGMYPPTKDRILSYFIDRYPIAFQRAYLKTYAGYGYTHLTLSPPDSLGDGGQSIGQIKETIARVKTYVPYVALNMTSKDYPPFGVGQFQLTVAQFKAYIDPLLDAFLPLADEFIPFWETDLYFPAGAPLLEMLHYFGQRVHAAGKHVYHHYSSGVTAWQENGKDRFSFWNDLDIDVDGLNYQTNPNWQSREVQDRLVDTLKFFGQTNRWRMRCWEDAATNLFWGTTTPDDANARQWLACCTYDNVGGTDAKVWGFGNGARRPDGTRI